MPRFFYVKAGGSLTLNDDTPYTSKQTSSFSTLGVSNYYPTLDAVFSAGTKTNPVAAGDFICCSDAHAETLSTDTDIGTNGVGVDSVAYLTSVSDSNCGNYARMVDSTGAITCVNGADFVGRGVSVHGLHIKIQASATVRTATNAVFHFWDTTFTYQTNNGLNAFYTSIASQYMEFHKCTFISNSSDNEFSRSTEGRYVLKNCVFQAGTGTFLAFHREGGSNGELYYEVYNTDLSPIPNILYNFGSNSSIDDCLRMLFMNCEVQNGVTWLNESFINPHQSLEAYGCTDSTSDNPNSIYIETAAGSLQSVIQASGVGTDTVRTDGKAMEMEAASEYLTLKVITSAYCSKGLPFQFKLPARWSKLSGASENAIRMYLASASTLYDDDVQVEISSRNATNPEQIDTVHSTVTGAQGNGSWDPLVDSTQELDSDTGSTWTNSGTLSLNEYQIDTATSGGMDQIPSVEVYVTKPSTTIYFDSEYGLN